MVERLVRIQEVRGSIPLISTTEAILVKLSKSPFFFKIRLNTDFSAPLPLSVHLKILENTIKN